MNSILQELEKGINNLHITFLDGSTQTHKGRIQLTEHWVIIYNHHKATMINGHNIKEITETMEVTK